MSKAIENLQAALKQAMQAGHNRRLPVPGRNSARRALHAICGTCPHARVFI